MSRSALEILKEGQNGYQTRVRVNSGVNRKSLSLWSSIKVLALWAVSATEQWIVSVLDEILLPSVKSEHGIGHSNKIKVSDHWLR